jgi:hypothetical protein
MKDVAFWSKTVLISLLTITGLLFVFLNDVEIGLLFMIMAMIIVK